MKLQRLLRQAVGRNDAPKNMSAASESPCIDSEAALPCWVLLTFVHSKRDFVEMEKYGEMTKCTWNDDVCVVTQNCGIRTGAKKPDPARHYAWVAVGFASRCWSVNDPCTCPIKSGKNA